MPSKAQTDWDEQRALVLAELKRLNQGIEDLKSKLDGLRNSDISELKAEIAVLKFKSGVWGFVAGAIPAFVAFAYSILKH